MALVLRIKFPPTYPLIYKTLRLDENLTVRGAVETIAETVSSQSELKLLTLTMFLQLHLPQANAGIGLYIVSALQRECPRPVGAVGPGGDVVVCVCVGCHA
jgi:hypothetical protein